jgi:hypothetical protein
MVSIVYTWYRVVKYAVVFYYKCKEESIRYGSGDIAYTKSFLLNFRQVEST